MRPALEYYCHTLTKDMWLFYWEELRDENPDELRARLKTYMQTRTTFPKVPHLKHVREATERPRGLKPSDHPDYSDTLGRAMAIALAAVEGHELHPPEREYPLDVEALAGPCIKYIEVELEIRDRPRRSVISEGVGRLALEVDRAFRRLLVEDS